MYSRRLDHRSEHRQQENLRINASPNMSSRFQDLKSLTVHLRFFEPGGGRQTSEIIYSVNLQHAKSILAISCGNSECIRGDFDLTESLARAVDARLAGTDGESCCQGWRSKTTIDARRCLDMLRYKLSMTYEPVLKG